MMKRKSSRSKREARPFFLKLVEVQAALQLALRLPLASLFIGMSPKIAMCNERERKAWYERAPCSVIYRQER